VLILVKDRRGIHVIGLIADLYFLRNELHRYVIADGVDGHGRVFTDLADDPVQEAFVQPFLRRRQMNSILCGLIPFVRRTADPGMVCVIVVQDVVPEHAVELRERMDLIDIKAVEPGLLQCPPLPLDLRFTGPVTDTGMKQYSPETAADEGELLIRIGAAVVDVKL